MKLFRPRKWKLTFRVIPFILAIVVVKYLIHEYNLEVFELSSIFTAVISANIFLIGFLITGVLADYKESEKLPGDLAVSIEAIADECKIMVKGKKSRPAQECLTYLHGFSENLISWFHREIKTARIMEHIEHLNHYFLDFEPVTQANFIVRMKQEQNTIRRIITRIHTIRETNFNEAGYTIAEIISALLITGMLFIQFESYFKSIFFVAFVSFILIYMLFLIKDLDDPFAYHKKDFLADEVSLKPLVGLQERLRELPAK